MQDLVNVVTLGSIYLLFALGMSITWGTIDILNFGHGSIFMFSTFSAYLVLAETSLPLLPVVLIGVLVGAAMSLLIQVVAFEQILKRAKDKRTAEMQILIGGIGVAIIPLAIAQHQTKSNPFGLSESSYQVGTWVIGDIRITSIAALTVVVAVLLWAATAIWLKRSRHGLALRAIGVDAETAALMGIDRRRLALVTMAASGGMAGLSGVLFTYSLGAITPESGDTLLVKAFACIILGGVGSMLGVAFGAYFLAAAETVVLTQTSGSWVEAVSFGLIFLVLLLRPAGVFGRKEVRRT
ncbi:branched-chain amino acid transport system permease protein [Kribbella sp. VKM Ac-2527]|uniref:Branched-chain amino acid transport system permease protein n=1 Tax=Kribbella caucasensis TaxID=2512215 RepID=A0A4R6KDZ9_9ACTN|nr:branched-chain amino acid ABC transporter permease [Kribbella sp. VKM Ac-2527]TDO48691.1 branched-chain amino acid transport system permease protein [Kribbella sp. VKM Ac-2527]